MQFILRSVWVKIGCFEFIQFDTSREYIKYDATKYPKWVVSRLRHMRHIVCSSNLEDTLLAEKQMMQTAQRKHTQAVLLDNRKQLLQQKLSLPKG